jgi:uncharacterized RDD family membrane protein YckC
VKRDDPKLIRSILTPEGIPLRFTLARATDRGAAFMFDIFVQSFAILGVAVGLAAAGDVWRGSWLTAVIIVVAFLIMNFYFVFFETRWQGSTPGKRRLGIRVVDARGGQLETSSIIARNLVRELEVWTPLRFLLARDLLWPGAPAWTSVAAVLWTLAFFFMPLFNRDRLRVGDLIAGTMVVLQPKVVLVPDLVDDGARARPAHEFTAAQLSIYGVYELQVLEDVLRTTTGPDQRLAEIADKVRTKIEFTGAVADDEQFLRDFYAAQRAHLEQRLLFGQRREDKYAQ